MKEFIERETFVDCECSCSKLVISVFKQPDPFGEYCSLTMYRIANSTAKLTLKQAFAVAYKAIFKRCIYEDYMLISKAETKRLANWLLKAVKEVKNEPKTN